MDSAYYHYAGAQKMYNALGDGYTSGRMLYNMAVVQSDVYDYTESEITAIKAIELLKPFNKYQQLYNCYNLLATVASGLQE